PPATYTLSLHDALPICGLRPSGSFLRFLLRRLVALVLLGVGITFVVFLLTQLVPSNAVATNLGEQAAGDPVAVATFKHHYGLDKDRKSTRLNSSHDQIS